MRKDVSTVNTSRSVSNTEVDFWVSYVNFVHKDDR